MMRRGGIQILFAVLTALSVLCGIGLAGEKDFALIVNLENPLDTISRRSVRQIFLNRQTHWPDGAAINIVLNDTSPSYEHFARKWLKKSPGQYLMFRKKLLFNGAALPPKRVKSDEEVIAFVRRHKNGIGVISTDSLGARVKKLDVEDTASPP